MVLGTLGYVAYRRKQGLPLTTTVKVKHLEPLGVEHDLGRLGLGVVAADRLDDAAVAGRPAIGDDDPPDGVLLPADAGETHGDGHSGGGE